MYSFFNHTSYLWFSLGFIPADLVQLWQFILIQITRTSFVMLASNLIFCSLSHIQLLMPCLSCVSSVCTTVSETPQVQVPDLTVLQRPLIINICPFAILICCFCQTTLLIAQNHFVICSSVLNFWFCNWKKETSKDNSSKLIKKILLSKHTWNFPGHLTFNNDDFL